MLGYYFTSASLMPSKMFSSSFQSIGSLLPLGHHSTSLQSARLQTGRLPSRLVLFFGPTRMLFDLSIALRLRHDLSKVAAPTPHSGACETWVPQGSHQLGSRRPRQVGLTYQKTRQPVSGPNRPSWQPTQPPEELPEDSPDDLIQHDLKTWRIRQDISGFRRKQIDRI
jgi:hypothetical protein